MVTPRLYHTATLLPDGRVLVTGGAAASTEAPCSPRPRCMTRPPAPGRATGPWLGSPQPHRDAAEQRQGAGDGRHRRQRPAQHSAEVYDAATGTWSPVGAWPYRAPTHSATLLPDGRVLVAGGGGSRLGGQHLRGAVQPGYGHLDDEQPAWPRRAARTPPPCCPSGRVLVAGGFHEYTGILTSAEVYEPSSGHWLSAGPLATGRYLHTATLLTDGRVLVAGGFSNGNQASAELYTSLGHRRARGLPRTPRSPRAPACCSRSSIARATPFPGPPSPPRGLCSPSTARATCSSRTSRQDASSLAWTRWASPPPRRWWSWKPGAHVGAQVKLLPLPEPIPFQAEQGGHHPDGAGSRHHPAGCRRGCPGPARHRHRGCHHRPAGSHAPSWPPCRVLWRASPPRTVRPCSWRASSWPR